MRIKAVSSYSEACLMKKSLNGNNKRGVEVKFIGKKNRRLKSFRTS
jgi:hypothetical protein